MNPSPSTRADGPLSLAQQRLWFLDRFENAPAAHQSQWIVRLHGPLEVDRFRKALEAVITRQEILRTTFPEVDGQPVARIHDSLPVECPLLEGAPSSTRPPKFDLAKGPLFAARLHRVDDDQFEFIWNAHEIVFDAQCMELLVRDLALAWSDELPKEKSSFADFAAREREFLESADAASKLAFWKEHLASPHPTLQYPLDRPRPATQTFATGHCSLSLGEDLINALARIARDQHTDLPTLLLAAYAVLLHRHTHQNDLTIGLPVVNRRDALAGTLLGPTEIVEVFRTGFDGNVTFKSFLHRTEDQLRNLRAQHGVPFERVLETVHAERNLSYHPIYQTAFAYRSDATGAIAFESGLTADIQFIPGTSVCDLSLLVQADGNALRCELEFNSDLFQPATAERLLGHYRQILSSIAGNPDAEIDRLTILTPAEREQVVVDWNATEFDHHDSLLLHQRFEQQAAHTPNDIAAIFGEHSLTFDALNRRANQLAHHLRAAGIGQEMRVGISMHRSFEMLVAILGVLKAGAGYVPLDPAVPAERLHYMIEDAQLKLILTQDRFLETLKSHGTPLLPIDTRWSEISSRPEMNPEPLPFADSLVYITYTSGTTGRPKGILMTQRPLLNLLGWMLRTTHLPPQARTLQFASLSFDVSFQDIFSTWFSGGTVVLITEAERQDLSGLASLLDRYGVHRIFLPAVALQQLAEGFCSGNFACTNLRKIISGSEQLVVTDPLRKMFTALPQCRLHNEYGPSEAHVVTELKMPDDPAEWAIRPAVGKPIDNTQMYIVDRLGQPVPIGVIGELHVAGVCLARGYLGREELTAEKFVPNPFSKEPGARMYRTGDQARWLANGDIEFVGRVDQQIKIRGYRIEPNDVESALEKHPQVREAFVMAREFGLGDTRLVAWLGLDTANAPSVSELRGFLATKLPEYMIPSAFVLLEKLPLNANGKVDRKALPAPDSSRPELATAFVAPQNDLEEFIAAQWRDLLRLGRVGARDNFFDLGGNSVMVVQIHHRLKKHLLRDIPLIALFQYPTIDTLAQFLGGNAGTASTVQEGIADRAARQRAAFAQRRLAATPR
jgi:amino acid adenylation domain-containing protein